jgi:hypothetical protein
MQISGWSSGLTGIKVGQAQLDAAAQETFDATVPTDQVTLSGGGDLVGATSDRIMGELMVRANLKVLQSSNQTNDVLLQLLTTSELGPRSNVGT